MDERYLKVGELARRSGVSIRTLHHDHEIGLLTPALGGGGEARLYGPEQAARLWRIRALPALGLSLEEIGACLSDEALDDCSASGTLDTAALVDRQLARVDARIEDARRLRARLESIAASLRAAEVPDTDTFLEATLMTERTEHFEQHYSPEQKQRLARRADEVGAQRMRAVQGEWQELFAAFREATQRGDDPSSEPARELARRAEALIEEFTGGDSGIRDSLAKAYADLPDPGAVWGVEPDVAAYMGAARRALGQ